MYFIWSCVAKNDLLRLYEHIKGFDENRARMSLSVLAASPWSLMPEYDSALRIPGNQLRDIRKSEVGGFEITYEVRKDSLVILIVDLKHHYLFSDTHELN